MYRDDPKHLVPHLRKDLDACSKGHEMLGNHEEKFGKKFPGQQAGITEAYSTFMESFFIPSFL